MNEAGRDVADIIHQARAHQIQQIISCVLRRDRRGLVELARRIDVAGLVGSLNSLGTFYCSYETCKNLRQAWTTLTLMTFK